MLLNEEMLHPSESFCDDVHDITDKSARRRGCTGRTHHKYRRAGRDGRGRSRQAIHFYRGRGIGADRGGSAGTESGDGKPATGDSRHDSSAHVVERDESLFRDSRLFVNL